MVKIWMKYGPCLRHSSTFTLRAGLKSGLKKWGRAQSSNSLEAPRIDKPLTDVRKQGIRKAWSINTWLFRTCKIPYLHNPNTKSNFYGT